MKVMKLANGEKRFAAFKLNEQWHSAGELLAEMGDASDDLVALLDRMPEINHMLKEIASVGDRMVDPGKCKVLLPFRPAAYRDFMLYEKHAIDAARGFAREYLPGVYPIIRVYEAIFRSPFPKLKPHKRFYKYPIYYLGNHLNFFTGGDPIPVPEYTRELDYELEIGALITKPLRNASAEEVEHAIGGFFILNDFSARDQQLEEMRSGFGPMKTKNFANAISSVLVSADELFPELERLQVSVYINDEKIIEANSGGARYSFTEAIAFASWEEQLHPGEAFGSGTIPGCTGIENGHKLKPKDVIRLQVEQIGELTNPIVL